MKNEETTGEEKGWGGEEGKGEGIEEEGEIGRGLEKVTWVDKTNVNKMAKVGETNMTKIDETKMEKMDETKVEKMKERRKRGPACLIRCLKTRRLHPAQCHALC